MCKLTVISIKNTFIHHNSDYLKRRLLFRQNIRGENFVCFLAMNSREEKKSEYQLSTIIINPFKVTATFMSFIDMIHMTGVSKAFRPQNDRWRIEPTFFTVLRLTTHLCAGCEKYAENPSMVYFRGEIKRVLCDKCVAKYCRQCAFCQRTRPRWFLQQSETTLEFEDEDKNSVSHLIVGSITCGDDSECFNEFSTVKFEEKQLADYGVPSEEFKYCDVDRNLEIYNQSTDIIFCDDMVVDAIQGWCCGKVPDFDDNEFIGTPSSEAMMLIDRMRADNRSESDGDRVPFRENSIVKTLFASS